MLAMTRLATVLALCLLGPSSGRSDDGAAKAPPIHVPGRAARKAASTPTAAFTPEHEAAALVFVGRHHPELASLLERLKPMNRSEYEKAIVDLFTVSESLAQIKQRDERRYELALGAWKARSRVELLAAQLVHSPSPELESQLRDALDAQIDVEMRRLRFERDQAEARLHKTEDALKSLEGGRGSLIESRLKGLLKKARRQERPAKRPLAKTETKPAKSGGRPVREEKGGKP